MFGLESPQRKVTKMIRYIQMDTSPVSPGHQRPVVVDSDGDVVMVLNCLRDHPPPPIMVPCGHVFIRRYDVVLFTVDDMHFPAGTSGKLELVFTDLQDGHVMRSIIDVR